MTTDALRLDLVNQVLDADESVLLELKNWFSETFTSEEKNPFTPEEWAAIEEGRRDIEEGRFSSWEEVKKELYALF